MRRTRRICREQVIIFMLLCFRVVSHAPRHEGKRCHQSCHAIVTCPNTRTPSSLSPFLEFKIIFMNPAELFRQESVILGVGTGDFLFREGESVPFGMNGATLRQLKKSDERKLAIA